MCRQLFHHLSLSFDASTHYNNSLQWLCLITIFSTSQPLHPFPEHVCRRQPARTRSSLYIFLCFISLCSYGRLIVRALPRWRLSRSRVRQNDNTHKKLTKKKKNRRWSSTLNSSQNIPILAHVFRTFLRIFKRIFTRIVMRIRDYHPKLSPQTPQNDGRWRGW